MAVTLLGVREDIVIIKHKLQDHSDSAAYHTELHRENDAARERIHHGAKVSESCIACMGGLIRKNGNGK